jgi:uncharacterized protein (TIGR00661 family)
MTILYGVPGEGLGHATRSKVIIAWLLGQGHEVRVVSSSRAFTLLDNIFPGRVLEIKGFHLAYKKLTVSKSRTLGLTLRTAPEALQVNFRQYRQLLHGFRPEVVISDFESFSYFFAKLLRVPVISIDNMQIINRAHLDVTVPQAEREHYDLARLIVRAKLPRARHYLVTTFFELPLRLRYAERTTLVPSIIRPEIQAASQPDRLGRYPAAAAGAGISRVWFQQRRGARQRAAAPFLRGGLHRGASRLPGRTHQRRLFADFGGRVFAQASVRGAHSGSV